MDYIKIATKVLDKLNPDYYDIRYEENSFTEIVTEKSKIDKLQSGASKGIGVRVVHNGAQGFYNTNLLTRQSVVKMAETAFKLAKSMQGKDYFTVDMGHLPQKKLSVKELGKKPVNSLSIEDKIETIIGYAKYGAGKDTRVKNTDMRYLDEVGTVQFYNSEGTEGVRSMSVLKLANVVTAKQGSRIEALGEAIGAIGGLEKIFNNKIYGIIDNNIDIVTTLLTAKRPKSGVHEIVLDPDISGTLAHEAVGHATEGDAIVTNQSVLQGKIGQTIASEQVGLSDDPTLKEFGYVGFDDEGVKPKKHKLIVDGVLTDYLLDRDSASKLNRKSNGAARASNARSLPQVRMSNTFFEAGDMKKEEVFEGIKEGYLIVNSVGGTTDPVVGTFNFTSKYCRKIENGELGEVMLPVVISGDILTTLKDVTHISKELRRSPGYCGKGGQLVLVTTGGPYMRLKKANIGGGT